MSFRRSVGALLATTLLLVCSTAFADYTLNMRPGVTEVSNRVYDLHNLSMLICTGIGIVVYGLMVYSIFRHRKSKGAKAATFHESTTVEVIWTIIPFVILIAIAAPATYTLIYMEDTSDPDLTVKVTGYQWYWTYEYVHDDIKLTSRITTPYEEKYNIVPKDANYLLDVDNRLVLPIGQKIRFLITSKDVIHSWWMPDFGIKKDAIPGFARDSWTKIDKPGVYRGQCAELCGADHGFMPIVVEAVTEEEFNQWKAKQTNVAVAKTHNMMNM